MNNRKVKILKTTIINDNNISNKRKKLNKKSFIFSVLVLLLLISIMIIPRDSYKSIIRKILAMAGIYTEEIKSIEIESNDYNNPGSFKITKSAKWQSTNKVQITFEVNSIMKNIGNNKDVILVLDTSTSIAGDKLNNIIDSSKYLVDMLLTDNQNRIALITFNSTYQVLSGFTNNKETIFEIIDNLTACENTNYNVGLQGIDSVMNSYDKSNNTDVVALFLTDGYPNEGRPNEVATYSYLKDKYPYLTINGIQYEMGNNVAGQIEAISDEQFVANMSNLKNILIEAAIEPLAYEKFIIEDYINTDYFNITSTDDINTSIGTATIEEATGEKKIVWNLGDNSYVTGSNKVMTIVLTLNDSIPSNKTFYPTNTKEIITYKLVGAEEQTKSSTDTPVLTNKYSVIYESNTPAGCVIENPASNEYLVYSTVSKSTNEITCPGYLFRGWKIDNDDDTDITHINEDLFVMPGHDVTVRAEWSNQSITKSVDGEVNTHATLYKIIQEESEKSDLAVKYTGVHQDSINSGLSTEDIYYYSGGTEAKAILINNKNNVVFGDHCWQMIRTTDTGGVKLLYNGEAVNNQCLNTRGTHVGYASYTTQTLNNNYWYGTDYIYDSINKKFRVSGDTTQNIWSDSTYNDLIGKYTCKSTSVDGTCSTLYLVESYNNSSSAYVIPLNSNSNYSQFGTLQFNAKTNSPAYVGYKYGDVYSYGTTAATSYQSFTSTATVLSRVVLSASYWYGDGVECTASNLCQLTNPFKVNSSEFINLLGKYTLSSTSSTTQSSLIDHIAIVDGTYAYVETLNNNSDFSNFKTIKFGDSLIDNGDDTYTITNPISVIISDWYTNYESFKNKYTCGDNNITCVEPMYITGTTSTNYTYVNLADKIMIGKERNETILSDTLLVRKDELIKNSSNYSDYKYTCNIESVNCSEENLRMIYSIDSTGYTYSLNHYYGSSVTWDGEKYTLVDPIGIENYNNLNNISTHHYMCIDVGSKSCSSIAYIYYYNGSGSITYITLKNGVISVSEALNTMLTNNTHDSIIKTGIDAWYKHFILEYDDFIEDTIYCNDRSISDFGGWNANGGKTNNSLTFVNSSIRNFKCDNDSDRFSINNNIAKLDYKVGLLTYNEINRYGYSRNTGQNYRLLTPNFFRSDNISFVYSVNTSGGLNGFNVNNSIGVRPAISLKPGTEYVNGNGSKEYPYIVDLGE